MLRSLLTSPLSLFFFYIRSHIAQEYLPRALYITKHRDLGHSESLKNMFADPAEYRDALCRRWVGKSDLLGGCFADYQFSRIFYGVFARNNVLVTKDLILHLFSLGLKDPLFKTEEQEMNAQLAIRPSSMGFNRERTPPYKILPRLTLNITKENGNFLKFATDLLQDEDLMDNIITRDKRSYWFGNVTKLYFDKGYKYAWKRARMASKLSVRFMAAFRGIPDCELETRHTLTAESLRKYLVLPENFFDTIPNECVVLL